MRLYALINYENSLCLNIDLFLFLNILHNFRLIYWNFLNNLIWFFIITILLFKLFVCFLLSNNSVVFSKLLFSFFSHLLSLFKFSFSHSLFCFLISYPSPFDFSLVKSCNKLSKLLFFLLSLFFIKLNHDLLLTH